MNAVKYGLEVGAIARCGRELVLLEERADAGAWWVWTRRGPRRVGQERLAPCPASRRTRAVAAGMRAEAEAHAKVVRSLMNPHAGRR